MAEDTSVQETVDVSNDDDIPDIPLTQMDAPAENKPSEQAEEGKDEAANTEEKDKADDNQSEGEGQPADKQEAPVDDEAAKRQHNNEQAQQRIQNRQRTQSNVAKDLNDVYGPKTQAQFLDEQEGDKNPLQAQLDAMQAQQDHDREVNRISTLNADMTMQSAAILQEQPVFNPNSPEYDKDFTEMVDQMYYKQANVQTQELPDGRQIVTNADFPLDEFYKQMADIRNRGVTKGSEQGQKQAMESFARTENVGGSSTSGNQSNSLSDLEERLGDMPIT